MDANREYKEKLYKLCVFLACVSFLIIIFCIFSSCEKKDKRPKKNTNTTTTGTTSNIPTTYYVDMVFSGAEQCDGDFKPCKGFTVKFYQSQQSTNHVYMITANKDQVNAKIPITDTTNNVYFYVVASTILQSGSCVNYKDTIRVNNFKVKYGQDPILYKFTFDNKIN